MGQKSLTNFTILLKIIICQKMHFNAGTMCLMENIQLKFQFFPCTTQRASIDCCDDIPDPCL